VIPGETILKNIYITVDGTVYLFVNVIWPAVEAAARAGKLIELDAELLSSPGGSNDVLATRALMGVGLGDEVERKFSHRIK
jgi:hypothetical protein